MAPVISSVVAATPVSAGGDAAAASAPPAVEPPAAPACQLKLTPVLVEHPGLSIELTIRAVVRPISPNCESKPPPVTKTSIGPMHSLQDPVGPLEPESDPHDTFQDPKNDPRGGWEAQAGNQTSGICMDWCGPTLLLREVNPSS
nr:uncharacterized protein LOC107281389 isoform X4 [Oryza sativa Japonica Group]